MGVPCCSVAGVYSASLAALEQLSSLSCIQLFKCTSGVAPMQLHAGKLSRIAHTANTTHKQPTAGGLSSLWRHSHPPTHSHYKRHLWIGACVAIRPEWFCTSAIWWWWTRIGMWMSWVLTNLTGILGFNIVLFVTLVSNMYDAPFFITSKMAVQI